MNPLNFYNFISGKFAITVNEEDYEHFWAWLRRHGVKWVYKYQIKNQTVYAMKKQENPVPYCIVDKA